jgi:hypothetical protein
VEHVFTGEAEPTPSESSEMQTFFRGLGEADPVSLGLGEVGPALEGPGESETPSKGSDEAMVMPFNHSDELVIDDHQFPFFGYPIVRNPCQCISRCL